jgi:ABC-type sugar transport system ATPase subunit
MRVKTGRAEDGNVMVGIRPEDLRWRADAPAHWRARVAGVVDVVEPMGAEAYVTVRIAETTLVSRFPSRSGVRYQETIELAFNPGHLHLFDARTGEAALERSLPKTP